MSDLLWQAGAACIPTSIELVLAAVLAGSAGVAPLVNAGASGPAATSAMVAKGVGAVVALTGSGHADSIAVAPAYMAHGMVAAEFAGTGNYGAPLINGCAWATWVTNCSNLTAYGNGSGFNNVGCGAPNGCEFGPEFQCEELAIRYAYYAWGEPTNWYPYGATGGASTMWQAGPALPIPLAQFRNGAGTPPMQGDLMIFAPGWLGSYWDGSGHVAIVRDVGPNYVDVVEQNATASGTDRFALNGSTVTAGGYTPIIGWLRETEQTPVELVTSNVAGTPQSVSDQPGDMDVIWRGFELDALRPRVPQRVVAGAAGRGDHSCRRRIRSRGGISGSGTGERLLGGHLGQPLGGPVAEWVLRGGDVAGTAGVECGSARHRLGPHGGEPGPR